MRKGLFHATILFFFATVSAQACELKLLLSWDVSPSMSAKEYQIQKTGTAEAFRHPAVKNLIALSRGGVAVALIQWAGPDEQVISIPWTMLRSGQGADAFADVIETVGNPFTSRSGTAIGNSLQQASAYLDEGPLNCSRLVIDISGDGKSNVGIDTATQADALERDDVTINGLVLPGGKLKVLKDDPYMFYVRNVSRGKGSFVMDVTSYADFPRAMRRKLIRELLPQVAIARNE